MQKPRSHIYKHGDGSQVTEWRIAPYHWRDYDITDLLHRVDGPAVEWSDGRDFWYINGKLYENFQKFIIAARPFISDEVYFTLLLRYST